MLLAVDNPILINPHRQKKTAPQKRVKVVNHFCGSMMTLMESFASATSLKPRAVSERPSR